MKNQLTTPSYTIYFGDTHYNIFNEIIENLNPSRIVILMDSNTHLYCLDYFMSKLSVKQPISYRFFPAGETYKNIKTCVEIWNYFSEINLDRQSLIINLGGGVVTDLGGFVASTYKRGLPFINVPTSLLSMVDASIGGKTGIDFNLIKNQIGVFANPNAVFVDFDFLKTLPPEEFNAGVAEILKHGLIYSTHYWQIVSSKKIENNEALPEIIYQSVLIKNEIVAKDPREQNLRKTLNFGHTLGHAIESYSYLNNSKKPLLHGEAVAIGLVLAVYLSVQLLNLPKEILTKLCAVYSWYFTKVDFNQQEVESIIELLKHDKKNAHGAIHFILINQIGHCRIDNPISNDLIRKAFDFYNSSFNNK